MSLHRFPSNHRRPRIATASSTATISPASSAAALVPRSVSTGSSLTAQRPRALSPPSREPIESYTLWQPILRASDQIVLYNPSSHAINIVPASLNTVSRFSLPFTNGHTTNGTDICPYCHRPMGELPRNFAPREEHPHTYNVPQIEMSPDYFQVLQDVNGGVIVEEVEDIHNTSSISQESFPRFEDEFDDSNYPSRRWSRVSIDSDSDSDNPTGVADRPESLRSLSGSSFTPETTSGTPLGRSTPVRGQSSSQPAERSALGEPEMREVNAPKSSNGYYSTFFKEETRLGMGANGSVYLCQHVLNGIPLGHFAVKKIAVGDSTSYLMEILREVRLHEKLHHRNIITYHHAWLESARFSTFGLAVPTLHVLMQWAELGSLDDLILQRLGVKSPDREGDTLEAPSGEYQTREDRIRTFRARAGGGGTAHASGESRRKEARRRAREMKAVHLLSAEEIHSLFGDVVAGLAFLHESSFLHLDLKPGNVLLTLDEGQLVPRAMLSDFGTAQDALQSSRERSGNTGTLEYSAPESLRHNQDGSLRQITSKSDMWSLGMILHKLIYFRLPWKNDEDMNELEKEIVEYQGYRAGSENVRGFTQRRLPVALCQLLSKLLDIDPFRRPGSDQVLRAIRARQLDPSTDQREQFLERVGPLVRRHTPPSRGNESLAVGFDNDSHIPGPLVQEPSPDMPSRDGRSRPVSGSQVRRSESVGELEISNITPRLLVLDGPVPVVGRIPGFLSTINTSRILSRGFKYNPPYQPLHANPTEDRRVELRDWARTFRYVDPATAVVVCARDAPSNMHLDTKQRAPLLVHSRAGLRYMSVVGDEMELDSDGEGSMEESQTDEAQDGMLVDRLDEYIFHPPPEEDCYGYPRLDRIPGKLFREIMLQLDLRSVISVRMTCKALDRAVSTTSGVWYDLVRRSQPRLLIGAHPVVMPFVDQLNGFQEDLLRCAYTLRSKWPNPGFQARLVTETLLLHTPPERIEQIHFVPDTMGRFFLTVTRTVVTLWTLEPDGLPHHCRIICQANPAVDDPAQIVQTMVARPGHSPVSYLAIQFAQGPNHELRTEIHQLRLSPPGANLAVDLGLCTMYDTEGALVAFSGYAAAYALNDAAQTILLCCWVTSRATRLVTPVRECEIRWQHASCRAVTISRDIIVVVRDSTAEIYPRDRLTLLDPGLEPPVPFNGPIRTQLHMLPITYATDVANFPSSFAGTPAIHIHQPRLLRYGTDANRFIVSTQVISVIGVARSDGSPSDPSIPYIVVPAKAYQATFTPSSSQPTSPSHTAPSSPAHTTPSPTHTSRQPSPTHTQPGQALHALPRMLIPPVAERDRFVFHIHALRLQNPHLSYGPIITGPQGRCVMLATTISSSGGPNQPRQFLLKFRHPSYDELARCTTIPPSGPRPAGYPGGPRPSAPSPHPLPPFQPPVPQHPHPPAHHPTQHPPPHPQAHHHPQPHPPQQGHVQLPPAPPHPLLNPAAYAPPPPRDPFAPLLALMKPNPLLDVLRGMSNLWYTYHKVGYELLAWEEGSGTILVTNERGDVAVLECARPAVPPLGASSWHLAPRLN